MKWINFRQPVRNLQVRLRFISLILFKLIMPAVAAALVPLVLTMALAGMPASAQGYRLAQPKTTIFEAVPGTNTLMAAREAVRAWRAAGHSAEPATIRLAPGVYSLTEPLVLAAPDGKEIWMARDSAKTLISGGTCIQRFTPDQNGLWRAVTDLRFEQLYVNGRRAIRARAPLEGYFNITSVKEDKLPNDRARITIGVPAAALAALTAAGGVALADVQLLVLHKWDTSRYAVASVDAAAGTLTVEGEQMKPWNPWNTQSRFILENIRTGLSQPGSWFLGAAGEVSYRPRPGERAPEIVAPMVGRILEIRDAAGIHFQGLRFQHAGYQMPAAGCPPVQAAAKQGAAIELDGASGVTFDDCEIAHTGTYGIWFRHRCHDCRLEHSLLADLGAGGVRIGEPDIRYDAGRATDGIIVDNNIIRGCGRVHPSAVGVWIGQSPDNRVTHNDISDTFYTGISVGWTWGYGPSLARTNLIAFNRVHQIGQGVLSDLGGIYTLGVSPGSACVGNVFYEVRAHDYGGWGIYPDEGSTGWRIESNLVWNCTCVAPRTGGAFHQHYGATNYIANNIFALSSGPPMQATRVENHLSFTLEHNLIISSNADFFTGPWSQIQFESRSNCFVVSGRAGKLFPTGDLSSWQQAGHEAGSILTDGQFLLGVWPDVTLPRRSPAAAVGFHRFDPKQAGVYGERAWKQLAKAKPAA